MQCIMFITGKLKRSLKILATANSLCFLIAHFATAGEVANRYNQMSTYQRISATQAQVESIPLSEFALLTPVAIGDLLSTDLITFCQFTAITADQWNNCPMTALSLPASRHTFSLKADTLLDLEPNRLNAILNKFFGPDMDIGLSLTSEVMNLMNYRQMKAIPKAGARHILDATIAHLDPHHLLMFVRLFGKRMTPIQRMAITENQLNAIEVIHGQDAREFVVNEAYKYFKKMDRHSIPESKLDDACAICLDPLKSKWQIGQFSCGNHYSCVECVTDHADSLYGQDSHRGASFCPICKHSPE